MDHPHVNNLQRITLLNVPLDIVPTEQVARIAHEFAEDPQHKVVIFLSYTKFMKALRDPEFLDQLNRAALVIPVSKILELGCKFLKLPTLIRHYPFDFAIQFLGALEEKRRTLYLLGDHHEAVQTIAANMRISFPRLTLVGRHSGHYGKDKEEPILLAIQKATPSVLLAGPGLPGKEKWAFRQGAPLPIRITLYSEDIFRIMAGRKKRPTRASFQKGTYEMPRSLLNPIGLVRVFTYGWFGLLLLAERLRKKT